MSDNVRPLHVPKAEPSARLIEALESILARAKTGEVRSLVIVASLTGRETLEYNFDSLENGDVLRLLGGIECLKARIVARCNED